MLNCQNVIPANNFEVLNSCGNKAEVVLIFSNEKDSKVKFTLCMECVDSVKGIQGALFGRNLVGGYSA